ncbi:RPL35A [Ecytonucleospora hepatopenaei]|uniref:RPL35A n=1 Tax=Ecytonucleospora hepatopenaei TaxID=646526 RepID=A0A1W0E3H3_9MICR|nr:RPL35A [Ecytonucleospora hepatopenaei]
MSLKAEELRTFTEEQLKVQLRETQDALQHLYQLRHSKQVQPNEIKEARKDIARIKTIQHENKLKSLVEKYKGKKHIPKELRPKKTRALRRALTKQQLNKKSRRQRQELAKYKPLVYTYTP